MKKTELIKIIREEIQTLKEADGTDFSETMDIRSALKKIFRTNEVEGAVVFKKKNKYEFILTDEKKKTEKKIERENGELVAYITRNMNITFYEDN